MADIVKNEPSIKLYEGTHKNYLEPKSISFCRPRRCDAFVYILSGSCLYTFADGRNFEARSGDILYLAEGSVYEMNIRERYDFICMNFFFDGSGDRLSDLFTPKDKGVAENLFYRAWRMQASGSLPAKMSVAYRIYDCAVTSRATNYISSPHKSKIEEAVAIITASTQSDGISVSSLARHAGMSEVYFRRLFRSAMGVSPAKFIINCRVDRAKELLSEDYLTPEEVSERCGFSSLSYFCRVFKESTGMTPGEFRAGLSK